MTNLLLVSSLTNQSKGGIAVWTESFLDNCKAYDIDCTLLNIATIGKRAEEGNAKRNFKDEFVRTSKIFSDLKSLLKKQSYDAAHLNTSCGTFGIIRDYITAKRIKRAQPKARLILHFHCNIEDQCKGKLSLLVLKRFLSVADEILVLNSYSKEYLKTNFNTNSRIVANFIGEDMIADKEKSISDSIKKALFVGYVRPEKGIREIYAVAPHFPEIKFDLAGELHDDIKSLDKPENVNLLGPKNRKEIFELMDTSDIFVFPTYSEGFSIALLESMARGLPSVATDVGSNKDMIGSVIPARNVEALKKAISELNDPKKRSEISLKLINKVKTEYTPSVVMAQMKKVYRGQ